MSAYRPLRRMNGSCHCGAVRFEIESDFPELTTCDCSMCRRRGVPMVKVGREFLLRNGGRAGKRGS